MIFKEQKNKPAQPKGNWKDKGNKNFKKNANAGDGFITRPQGGKDE